MKRIVLPATLFLAASLAAQPPKPPQDDKKPVAAEKAPVLPDALLKRYFKAVSESLASQNQSRAASEAAQAKQAALSAVVKEVTAACGEKFEPQMDNDGDPACVAKPPAVKK